MHGDHSFYIVTHLIESLGEARKKLFQGHYQSYLIQSRLVLLLK